MRTFWETKYIPSITWEMFQQHSLLAARFVDHAARKSNKMIPLIVKNEFKQSQCYYPVRVRSKTLAFSAPCLVPAECQFHFPSFVVLTTCLQTPNSYHLSSRLCPYEPS